MNTETNLIDLLILSGKGLKRWALNFLIFLEKMIFLTIRRWYVVFPVVILCVGYVVYIKLTDNRSFWVEGVVTLHGPTKEECIVKINQLKNARFSKTVDLSKLLNISKSLAKNIGGFKHYDVIDCLNDGTPDYIDYKNNTSRQDTLFVHMIDRCCIRFSLKGNIDSVPFIEKAILDFFNSDPSFITEHQYYLINLQNEKRFYEEKNEKVGNMLVNPDRSVEVEYKLTKEDRLVRDNGKTDKIIEELYNWERIDKIDKKLQNAVSPVRVVNHFTVEPKNRHMLVLFTFVGWVLGCILAWCIENRKQFYAKYKSSVPAVS